MLTVHIRHLAAFHPRTQRLRKRQARQLRPIRPSRRNELWYRAELGSIVEKLSQSGAKIADKLRAAWPLAVADGVQHLAAFDETKPAPPHLPSLLEQEAAQFGNIEGVATRLAALAARRNLGEVDARLSNAIHQSVGVDVREILKADTRIAPAFHAAVAANVDLITSIPAQYLARIREEIEAGWQEGIRWESMAEKIQYIGDVTESRAKLIARDQTGKMNSAFNRVRQTSVGIDRYTWLTAQDERVRRSHGALNGTIQRWDSPPMVDGEAANPGEPINCRCVPIPVFDMDEIAGAEEAVAA